MIDVPLLDHWRLGQPVVIDCALPPAPPWAQVASVTITTHTSGEPWLENTGACARQAGQLRIGAGLVLADARGELDSRSLWHAFAYPWTPPFDGEIDFYGPSAMRWSGAGTQAFTLTLDALRFRRTSVDGLHHCWLLVSPLIDVSSLYSDDLRGWRIRGTLSMTAEAIVTYL